MDKDFSRYLREFGTYLAGDNKTLNSSNVSILNYRIFSTIEHLTSYGNVVLSNLYPELRNSTGIEDLVTLDVALRDFKSILGYLGHIKRERHTGIVGSTKDLSNLARRVWKHLDD